MRRHSPLHHTTWLVPLALLALFLFLFTPPLCAAERGVKRTETSDTANRHALVIGNSDYQQAGRLRNPVNDARAMSRTLGGLGFAVTVLVNAGQRKMDTAIRKFGKTLRKQGGVGLFYYAGHGMQIEGEKLPGSGGCQSQHRNRCAVRRRAAR